MDKQEAHLSTKLSSERGTSKQATAHSFQKLKSE